MNNSASSILAFLVGSGLGFGAGVLFLKKKYSKESANDINEIRRMYEEKAGNDIPKPVKKEEEEKPTSGRYPWGTVTEKETAAQQSFMDYAKRITEERYATREAERKESKPYVISPDEYGEDENYACIEYVCYADDVIVDEDNKIVTIEDTIGREALKHFGEYEDDSVYIRDDKLKCDYSVIRDPRTYEEAFPKRPKPHQVGDD